MSRRQPGGRPRSRGSPASPRVLDVPGAGRPRGHRRAGRAVRRGGLAECAAKGVHGLVVHVGRASPRRAPRRAASASATSSAWRAPTACGSSGPTPSAWSTPTPTCGSTPRWPPDAPRAAASACSASPAPSASPLLDGAAAARARHVHLRVGGQPGRRQRQRPDAVLAGRPGHRRRAALPRVDRQPAQVHAGSPGALVARQAGRRREAPAGRAARCRTATACATTALPRAAVDALFRQAGVIRVETITRAVRRRPLVARQPLPAGAGSPIVGNSDALGLLTARRVLENWPDCEARRRPASPCAPEATAEEFAAARRARCSPATTSTASSRCFMPAAGDTRPRTSPRVVAAAAQRYGQTTVATFLGIRGRARAAARRTRRHDAALGLGALLPDPRGAPSAPWSRPSRYAAWRAAPRGQRCPSSTGSTGPRRAGWSRRGSPTPPRAARSRLAPRRRSHAAEAATAYASSRGLRQHRRTRRSPPPAGSATPSRSRRPARTCAHRTDLGGVRLDLADDGTACGHGASCGSPWARRPSATRGAADGARGVPVVIAAVEDPPSARSSPSGSAGSRPSCSATAHGFPPVTDGDAAGLVRGVRAPRCCSATAAARTPGRPAPRGPARPRVAQLGRRPARGRRGRARPGGCRAGGADRRTRRRAAGPAGRPRRTLGPRLLVLSGGERPR